MSNDGAYTPPPTPSTLPPKSPASELETFYEPIYIITGVFGAIFIIGPLVVRKTPHKGIIRACIMLAAFCMWIFWVTMYIAQMNPLIGPRVHNHTLAWVAHTWGESISSSKTSQLGDGD